MDDIDETLIKRQLSLPLFSPSSPHAKCCSCLSKSANDLFHRKQDSRWRPRSLWPQFKDRIPSGKRGISSEHIDSKSRTFVKPAANQSFRTMTSQQTLYDDEEIAITPTHQTFRDNGKFLQQSKIEDEKLTHLPEAKNLRKQIFTRTFTSECCHQPSSGLCLLICVFIINQSQH